MFTKNNGGDIAVLWTSLFALTRTHARTYARIHTRTHTRTHTHTHTHTYIFIDIEGMTLKGIYVSFLRALADTYIL